MKRLLTILLILTGMILTVCAAPAEVLEETPTAKRTLEPQVVAEWSRTGTKTTEPFTITETPWAVSWAFNPAPPVYGMYANLLQVYVKKVGDDLYLKLPVNIANIKDGMADSSYLYDKGTFYLEINSMSGTWSIEVYEFK